MLNSLAGLMLWPEVLVIFLWVSKGISKIAWLEDRTKEKEKGETIFCVVLCMPSCAPTSIHSIPAGFARWPMSHCFLAFRLNLLTWAPHSIHSFPYCHFWSSKFCKFGEYCTEKGWRASYIADAPTKKKALWYLVTEFTTMKTRLEGADCPKPPHWLWISVVQHSKDWCSVMVFLLRAQPFPTF